MNCTSLPARSFSLILILFISTSCSLRKRAVNTLAEVLGNAENVYLSDDDPELVGAALPFNLKTLETLLESDPEHRGLLLSATKLFTFYSYGYLETDADQMEVSNFRRAREIRQRSARLYMRAYRYGLRGLEVGHAGFSELLPQEPEQTCARLTPEDVPLAVWTAAALGSAIGASMGEAEATADIAVVGALLHRALELDEDFEKGSIHEFLIAYESQAVGGSVERAREHYMRAMDLSEGRRCGTRLALAENVAVKEQNRPEFEHLLQEVLSFDLNSAPENRLLNILAQRRARWLETQVDELFFDTYEKKW